MPEKGIINLNASKLFCIIPTDKPIANTIIVPTIKEKSFGFSNILYTLLYMNDIDTHNKE
jgi:hypothetical protein